MQTNFLIGIDKLGRQHPTNSGESGAALEAPPTSPRHSQPVWLSAAYAFMYAIALGLAMNSAFPTLGWGGNQLVSLSGVMTAFLCWQVACRRFESSSSSLIAVVLAWGIGVIVAGLVSGIVEQVGKLSLYQLVNEQLSHRLASYFAMSLPAILPFVWGRQADELLRRRLEVQLDVEQTREKLAAAELAMLTSGTNPDELIDALGDADRALASSNAVEAQRILDSLASLARERLSCLSRSLPPPATLSLAGDNTLRDGFIQTLSARHPLLTKLLAWESLIVIITVVEAYILNQPLWTIGAFVHIVAWLIALGAALTARWLRQPIDSARPVIWGVVFGNITGKMLAGGLIIGSPWFLFVSEAGRAVMPFSLFFSLTGAAIIWKYGELRRAQTAVAKAALRQQESQRLLSSARVKALKAQIEPHFLFNTLSNIVAQTSVDPTKARRMIALLTGMLARIDPVDAQGSLGEELDLVRNYLELQGLRIGPRLSWNVSCPNELLGIAFPSLLLQPLVENSIRHGIETVAGNHRVDVCVTRDETRGRVVIDVIDTGRGFASRATPGVGLVNIRERLLSIFGDTGNIDFRPNSPTGMHATVRIPLTSGA